MNATPEPIVTVRGLRHVYGEGSLAREVLHGIDVEFRAGEIAIIMGHSGSGKTTFLTLVSALREVQTGEIMVAGNALRGATPARLTEARRAIGFVFQNHNLLASLTARQNVMMALLLDGKANDGTLAQADALLARVGLAGHEHKRPREMSGGQQQRVALARALARRPRVLMADEPTASLDAQTGREMIELIQGLARSEGCAVLIVTHDSRILDVADRILTLDDGYLVESDAMFERLLDEMAALHDLLAAVMENPAATPGVARRFERAAEALATRVAGYVGLRLRPELAQRADALQQLLGTLRAFEVALVDFSATAAAAPGDLREGLGDALMQSLGAVMLTAGDALRVRTEENGRLLRELTGDRSDLLKRVRDLQLARTPGADDERRAAVFALTNRFARAIYLLGQVARFLDELRRRGAT